MSTGEIIFSGIISAVIVLYVDHKHYRNIIEKVKVTDPICKHIDAMSYFKGDNFSIKM